MSDQDTANTALVNAVTGPRRVTGDAGSVEQFTPSELIAAANYLAGVAASTTRNRGLRFTRLEPDGTAGRRRRGGFGGDPWPYGFGG